MNQKQQIGKVASSLLEEQDVIFIDSGTTACQIIPFMNEDMHMTVITHSALAFEMLEGKKNVKVILLGGEYREKVKSFFLMCPHYIIILQSHSFPHMVYL